MYLTKGSTIAIAATARHVDKEMIEVSVAEGGDLQYSLTEKGKKYTLGDD